MEKFLSLLAVIMMTTMGVWAEEAPHSHEGLTPIANLADLTSLMENGGKGYLTADITLTGNITANKEVYLCLADHMIDGEYAINFLDNVTIDDCGSTERYWQTNSMDKWIPAESAEGDFVTTGGVIYQPAINLTTEDKTFNLLGGNIINSCYAILNMGGATFNMSGGRVAGGVVGVNAKNAIITGGQIDHNIVDGVSAETFVMTGGRISDNNRAFERTSSDAAYPLFLGGIIENHNKLWESVRGYVEFVVGGDVIIRNNNFIDPLTLRISSETPLREGAYIELPVSNETAIPATSDVSPYFAVLDPSQIAKYDETEKQIYFASRIKSQPSSKNGYLFDVETYDLASVEYQWYETVQTFEPRTDADVLDHPCCSYGDGKWTKKEGSPYWAIQFNEEPGTTYRLTFDDELPEDYSIEFGEVISRDGKVLIVKSDDGAAILIVSDDDMSFTVEKFSEVKTLVEGQTTSVLTNGEKDKSYACGVNVHGRMLYSAVVTFENITPTAIESINADKAQKAVKTIENGKVVIIRGDKKYNLSGREL